MLASLLVELSLLSLIVALLLGVRARWQPRWLETAWGTLLRPAADPERERLRPRRGSLGLVALFVACFAAAALLVWIVLRARGMSAPTPLATIDLFDRWDVGWYRAIATEGYGDRRFAFWPLFPLVTGLVGRLCAFPFHRAGTLVSAASLLVTAFGLSLYLRDRPRREAIAAALVLAFSPVFFVLLIAYSESLFLMLSFFCLWFYARDKPVLSGCLGFLAALCRYAGILLFAALVLAELAKPRGSRGRRSAVPLLLIPLGTLAFMAFCLVASGDPLAMLSGQAEWGVKLLPSNLLRSLFHHDLWRMVTTNPIHAWTRDPPPGFFEYLLRLNLQVSLNRVAPFVVVPITAWMVYRTTSMPLSFRLYGLITALFPLFTVPADYLRDTVIDFPLFLYVAEVLSSRPWALGLYVAAGGTCLAFYAWAFAAKVFP